MVALRHALVLVLALGAAACASGGSATGRGRSPSGPAVHPGAAPRGTAIASQARMHAGTAYRPGGASPAGFDCSGFVQYLYSQAGVALPRTAEAQFDAGRSLRPRDIAAGDLVFFRTDAQRVSHVGIATGDGGFIHAPNARSRVRIDRLDTAYWANHFAGARRVVEP